jgi:hypothetical protein
MLSCGFLPNKKQQKLPYFDCGQANAAFRLSFSLLDVWLIAHFVIKF